jgi:hypothetical protein
VNVAGRLGGQMRRTGSGAEAVLFLPICSLKTLSMSQFPREWRRRYG